jgi:NADPH:quinone reductase
MGLNARYQFVQLYTVGWDRIIAAGEDISRAIEDSAFRVGGGRPSSAPLQPRGRGCRPCCVEGGATGKVLITVATS